MYYFTIVFCITVICVIFAQKIHVKYFRVKIFFAKLTALLEYRDLLQNYHVRNFCMIFAYEINLAAK